MSSLIKQMGLAKLPGSSTREGWLYQPMGDLVDWLKDVPIHKPDAVRDDYQAVVSTGVINANSRVCDLGCATGYYPIRIAREYGCPTWGIEADPTARAIAEQLGVEIVDDIPDDANTLLMMNIHMWLPNQAEVMNRARHLTTLFQTAGQGSGGMRKDPFLNRAAEEKYLRQYWRQVDFIRTTNLHGGRRFLWLLRP